MRPFAALAIAAFVLSACATHPLPTDASRYAGIVAAPDRSAADRVTDVRRKPAEMLAFIGVQPGMTVEDLNAARGYTSELLARAVAPTGKVYAQNAPRVATRTPPPQPQGAAAPAMPNKPTAPAPTPTRWWRRPRPSWTAATCWSPAPCR